jgi:hypothetical protein
MSGCMRGAPLSQRERVVAKRPGEGSIGAGKRRPRGSCPRYIRCSSYFLDDPIEPFFHFVVGEAKFEEPMSFDQRASRGILLDLFQMLLAIDLDRQTEVVAAEIGDEARNRRLPSEFQAIEPTPTKLLPKQILGRRALPAQASGNRGQAGRHAVSFAVDRRRSQPLTRPLRGHPLPLGEGLEPICSDSLSLWERVPPTAAGEGK